MSGQPAWPFVLCLALAPFLISLFRPRRYPNAKNLPLPPGPKPLPLIGNALDIPTEMMGQRFRDMSLKYGDISYLDALGQPMIIVNSHEIASDIMDKRSANYSDRMPSIMGEISGWEWTFTTMSYGPEWRRRRRELYHFFHQNAVPQYQPLQEREVAKFLRRVLDEPGSFLHQVRHAFASTIMRVSYGIKVSSKDDPYVDAVEKGVATFNEIFVPGAFLVETFPTLRHLPSWAPGGGFKRIAAKWQKIAHNMRDAPFARTLRDMKEGTAEPSITTKVLEGTQGTDGVDIEDAQLLARDTAALAYAAGGDTTISAVQTFFMAMACYPEVQRKARLELDAVVGPWRLPTFADRDSLPYIAAIVKEAMRWQSVVPLGVPHRSRQDDEYNGYFIPAGSSIIANLWGISRNEKTYPDPESFKPERFLTKEGKLNHDVLDPAAFVFGYGRRICPGRFFAENSLFIMISSILHTLSIEYAQDRTGRPILPEAKMSYGVISYPEPFPCAIKPRSPAYENLINAALGL